MGEFEPRDRWGAAAQRDSVASRLTCALLRAGEPERFRCQALLDSLDPQQGMAWLVAVERHGVWGVIHRRLLELDLSLPAEIMARLSELTRHATIRALAVRSAAQQALSILSQDDAAEDVVVFKGLHLLPSLYGDGGARGINDADFLIRHDAREPVHASLLGAGYRYVAKPVGRPASQQANYERSYVSRVGIGIDVHVAICPTARLDVDYSSVFARSLVASGWPESAGVVRVPSDEDTVLFLAIHMAQDSYLGPFRQLVDLGWWVAHRTVQWDKLVPLAQQAGAATALWAALWLVRDRLEVPVPAAVMHQLAPGALRSAYLVRLFRGNGLFMLPLRRGLRRSQALTLLPVLDSHRQRTALVWRQGLLLGRDLFQSRLFPSALDS